MRPTQWSRISWWQKSRLLSLLGIGCAVALMLLVIITLGNRDPSEAAGRFGALMFSIVPLLVVFTIALFARISEQINLRSGGQTAKDDTYSRRGQK